MKKIIFSFVLAVFAFYSLALAQEVKTNELLEMNLEELLSVKIVSGSIMKQSIENSPIIIDVISKEQIQDFNAEDLYELLSYVPGVEMMEVYFGRTVLNFRGVKNYNYTNKTLLTINGKPMFEPVNGSYFLEMVPVNSIERIEVIRGQGGTLLGTNAYSGVINIVTSKGTDPTEKLSLTSGYGSFNTLTAKLNTNYKINPDAGIYFGASIINGKGYPFNVVKDEGNNSGTINYKNNYMNAYLNLNWGGLSFDAGYMGMKKMKFGITPNINYSGLTDYNMYYGSVNFKNSVSGNLNLTSSLKFNRYSSPEGDIGYFPTKVFGGHNSEVYLQLGGYTLQAEVQSDYKISEKLGNITGLVYEFANSDKYEFLWYSDDAVHPNSAYLQDHSSYTVSAYSQFEYKPLKELQAVAGIRVVKDQTLNDLFFSPRVGLIYSPDNKYFFKLLYGQGFRTPTFFEKYVATYNVLYGKENLNPERADNYDLVIEALFGTTKTRLNGYLSNIKNDITRAPTPAPGLHGPSAAIYINDPAKYIIYGVEYSINGSVSDIGYYGFNIDWKTGENSTTGEELLYSANVKSSAWFSYKFTQDFSVTPYLQFIGQRKGKYGKINYTLDNYLLGNVNLKYKFDLFTIDFTINNVLNVDYTYPEFVRAKIEDISGGPERSYRLQLNYSLF